MHYYQFNIGDYRAATAHLSNEEDLAYRRLLDMYYDTEQKIPLDTQWVSKRLRLATQVVDDVLNDMFVRHEDGWFHARCDDLINQYHAMAEKNRANGRLGGRKKNPVGSESHPIAKATINEEPITINHKPKKEKATVVAAPEGVSEEVWDSFVKQRKTVRAVITPVVINSIAEQAKLAGWTLEKALAECAARGWRGFKAEWVAPKQTFAQQAADIARSTVPAHHTGRDPILLKIEADMNKAVPPSIEQLEKMAEIRRSAKK